MTSSLPPAPNRPAPAPHGPERARSALGAAIAGSGSVAVRIATLSVTLAVLIGMVLSSIQVVVDLVNERRHIRNTIEQVMRTLGEPAEQALYTVDRELARTVVDGLFKYDSVFRARVEDDYGEVFAARERTINDGAWRSALRLIAVDRAEYALPIHSHGRSVGQVAVSVDLFSEMLDFFDRALLVFAAGFVRNFVLVVGLILLYHAILVRPLSRLSQDLAAIVPGGAGRVGVPARHRADELGRLVASANHLLEGFESALRERYEAEEALRRHQADLDRIIAERTAALQRLVVTDPLTGLLNRRGLVESWHGVREQAVRTNRTLCVLLLDIDFFKHINDRHGHEVGDRVLCLAATTLAHGIRAYDLCARWGGEEFLIILVDVDPERLAKIGEGIRATLRSATLPDVPVTLTVSIGATLVAPQDSLDQAIGRADAAMYEAKASGRDTMRIFDGGTRGKL